MSEYTPITDELRKYEALLHDDGSAALARIGEFCDAIDAVHAQLERENAALKAELDRVLGEQDNGAIMPLPKDMNDEPIHIGDVMEWYDGETFEVVGIGDGVLFYVEDGHELADWTGSSTKRHHAPDTWERIIEDACKRAVDGYPDETGHIAMTDLVARCKALCERTKEGKAE